MTTPAVMLSLVSRRLRWRPASEEAQAPELGITCMTPMAFATETCRWLQADSCQAMARASRGSRPCRLAVSMIMARVEERLGRALPARDPRGVPAAPPTALEYVRPAKVLPENPPRTGMRRLRPARISEPAERPLALRIEAWLTPWRRARAPTVSPDRTVTRTVLIAGAAAARAARTALADTRRCWPGRMTDARRRPLAASRLDSDVPSRSAIAPTVSPGRTVYDV